jgi:hypothetical protein
MIQLIKDMSQDAFNTLKNILAAWMLITSMDTEVFFTVWMSLTSQAVHICSILQTAVFPSAGPYLLPVSMTTET